MQIMNGQSATARNNRMKIIDWTPSFSVGDERMDAQHRKIIQLINDLIEAQNSDELPDRLHQALYDMFEYSRGHLHDEEQLLRRIGYPDIDQHLAAHEAYIERMSLLSIAATGDESVTSLETIRFLREWWENHILKEDMAYARMLKNP